MKVAHIALIISSLLAIAICQARSSQDCENSIYDDPYFIPTKKGLTYTATKFPSK